jgi:hypothetical protein
MDGSHVSPGWTGRIILGVRLDTRGVGIPVLPLAGERTGDHRGHSVLYGGIVAQYCTWIELVPIKAIIIIMAKARPKHS